MLGTEYSLNCFFFVVGIALGKYASVYPGGT